MSKSNSKLSAYEKEDLKAFKQANTKAQFFHIGRVTVLELNGGVTVSNSSLSERKLRPKVGEYWASVSMERRHYIPLASKALFDSYAAEQLAYGVAGRDPYADGIQYG